MWKCRVGCADPSGRAVEVFEQHLSHRRGTMSETLDHRVDGVVAQLREKARFPLVQRSFGIAAGQYAVEPAIRYWTERIHDWRTEALDRLHSLLAVGYGATVAGDHRRQLGAGTVRGVDQCRHHRVLIGDRRGEVP